MEWKARTVASCNFASNIHCCLSCCITKLEFELDLHAAKTSTVKPVVPWKKTRINQFFALHIICDTLIISDQVERTSISEKSIRGPGIDTGYHAKFLLGKAFVIVNRYQINQLSSARPQQPGHKISDIFLGIYQNQYMSVQELRST